MFNKKTKEKVKDLIKLGIILIKDVTGMKEEIEKLQNDKKKMVTEMEKRDRAFMEFLKVELTTVKTAEKDQFGKDFVKSTYKLIKK